MHIKVITQQEIIDGAATGRDTFRAYALQGQHYGLAAVLGRGDTAQSAIADFERRATMQTGAAIDITGVSLNGDPIDNRPDSITAVCP